MARNRGLLWGCQHAFVLFVLVGCCTARIHKLKLKNERRSIIHLNSFGFYANGTLDVNVKSLTLTGETMDFEQQPIGFSLSKSRVGGMMSYAAEESDACVLTKPTGSEPLVLFLIHFKDSSVQVKRYGDQKNIITGQAKTLDLKDATGNRVKRVDQPKQAAVNASQPKQVANKDGGDKTKADENTPRVEKGGSRDGDLILVLQKTNSSYNFSFQIKIVSQSEEGMYNLNFHRCFSKLWDKENSFSIDIEITERNPGGFLSAAEMPLPLLYISMSGFFFAAALLWVHVLVKHRFNVFKIHWLMAALAFTKSISLIFHSINFHFINTEGHPIEGWAVMYYITHLLKGALLFITLALIGTGWAFVKYILSDKEKKIFMIVIPLQVLANVAYIILESTEEGTSEYDLWKEILFLVDLICCGAILFPVVWSIRHLQEASSTDGKAVMNLAKLKLFRHYYVMIVCYIYFTRIIAILLKVTVPFQWQWFYELLVEVSTLVFFVLTGYKFRPASNNPYLQLPLDEEDVEMDEVVTESGVLEGISNVKKTSNGRERLRD